MTSKYDTLKTTDIGGPWKGEVDVDNVRTYPDEEE